LVSAVFLMSAIVMFSPGADLHPVQVHPS